MQALRSPWLSDPQSSKEDTMKKRILGGFALCSMALIFSIPALAVTTQRGVTTSKDGRLTLAPPASASHVSPGAELPDALQIYNNLSTYPLGRYWCCSGWTISGPNSLIGETFAAAMPFTPAGNATVTKIVVAVGYVTGTNGVTVSLNSDAGGLPGAALASFDLSGLPQFGTCCTLQLSNTGVPVTGGTKYWVVVATGDDTLDTWDAWNQNDTNQTNQPFASFNNGVWSPSLGILGGFAVLGKRP
jgi:hypothetical protein